MITFNLTTSFIHKFSAQLWAILISPILADIVMHDLENFALSELCFESVFYFRYVEDILLCVPSNMIEYPKTFLICTANSTIY